MCGSEGLDMCGGQWHLWHVPSEELGGSTICSCLFSLLQLGVLRSIDTISDGSTDMPGGAPIREIPRTGWGYCDAGREGR